MGASILKKLNDKTPDIIKYIFSGLIRKKLIKNEIFIQQYEELNKYNKLDLDEKKKIQFERLKNHICYAYENTSYYKKLFDEVKFDPYKFENESQLDVVPLLTKNDIISNYEEFISKENINYYISSTGGSTGKPLKIYLEKDSIYKEKAFIYNHWSKLGYDYKTSKIVTFRGLEFNGKIKKYNPLYNEIIFNPFIMNDNNIIKYKKIIERYNPEFIHGYQSAIYNLCKLLDSKNEKLSVNIKGVFFISETVDEDKKQFIEKFLGCKSLAFYGHTERAVFGEEYNDDYSFNMLYGYTENINIDNQDRIVCTGFLNRKMPLIRYLTDDVIEIENNKRHIVGHKDKEILIGKNGEMLSITILNLNTEAFEKIRIYQFEQIEPGKVTFKIVQDQKLEESDIKKIKKVLDSKINNILDYKIEIVDNIKLSNRGKYSKVIQLIK